MIHTFPLFFNNKGPRDPYLTFKKMVGKVFLRGVMFTIVYNELGHKKGNSLNTFFLSQSSGKNISLLKTEMEGHEPVLC